MLMQCFIKNYTMNTEGVTEQLPSSKLRHDVGEREGEVVQVLPGWLGS